MQGISRVLTPFSNSSTQLAWYTVYGIVVVVGKYRSSKVCCVYVLYAFKKVLLLICLLASYKPRIMTTVPQCREFIYRHSSTKIVYALAIYQTSLPLNKCKIRIYPDMSSVKQSWTLVKSIFSAYIERARISKSCRK